MRAGSDTKCVGPLFLNFEARFDNCLCIITREMRRLFGICGSQSGDHEDLPYSGIWRRVDFVATALSVSQTTWRLILGR
jgi:hypothetical protein